ncbi:unnamed protein product [Caenorhabditis angaria]|uniref:Uncharacterized protein n=1 Tax=Caenorhabditis angaria TaxID=860376 RepID=A0A9P1IA49_9PELO|nr:unnamed protein product [Caenorhabditis angaria]
MLYLSIIFGISIILTLFALILNHFIAKHWGPSKQLALFLKFATGLTIIALLCAIILFSIIKSQKDAMEIEKLSETMQKTENYLKDSHEKLNGISTTNLKIAHKINVSMVSAEILDIIDNRTDFSALKSTTDDVDDLLVKIDAAHETANTGTMSNDCKNTTKLVEIKKEIGILRDIRLKQNATFVGVENDDVKIKEDVEGIVETMNNIDISGDVIDNPVGIMKKSLEYFHPAKIDIEKMESARNVQVETSKTTKNLADFSIYAQNILAISISTFALFSLIFKSEICLKIVKVLKYILAVTIIIFAIFWIILSMKMDCEIKFNVIEMIAKYHEKQEISGICQKSESEERIFEAVNYTDANHINLRFVSRKFGIAEFEIGLWQKIQPKLKVADLNFTNLLDNMSNLRNSTDCFKKDELLNWQKISEVFEAIVEGVDLEFEYYENSTLDIKKAINAYVDDSYEEIAIRVLEEAKHLLTTIDSSNLPCSTIHQLFSTANSSICKKYYTIDDLAPILVFTILTNLTALLILIISSRKINEFSFASGRATPDFSD